MSDTSTHTHHGIDYIELTVTDLEAAKRFYRSAFGWQFNDYGPAYAGIRRFDGSDGEAGGLAPGTEVRTGGPLVLLYSEDLETSLRSVGAAGGTVTEGPFDFPAAADSTSPTPAVTNSESGPPPDPAMPTPARRSAKDFGLGAALC